MQCMQVLCPEREIVYTYSILQVPKTQLHPLYTYIISCLIRIKLGSLEDLRKTGEPQEKPSKHKRD